LDIALFIKNIAQSCFLNYLLSASDTVQLCWTETCQRRCRSQVVGFLTYLSFSLGYTFAAAGELIVLAPNSTDCNTVTRTVLWCVNGCVTFIMLSVDVCVFWSTLRLSGPTLCLPDST